MSQSRADPGLFTHGESGGRLLFSDGKYFNISELNSKDISANIVGIASCFANDVTNAWASLNVANTQFINLSDIDPQHPNDTSRSRSLNNVVEVVDCLK